jgi:hypothetical protein
MDNKRLLELALEGLHAKKQAIELEIHALSKGVKAAVSSLRGAPAAEAPAAEVPAGETPVRRRKARSPAARKAQAEKMKSYWAARKAQELKVTRKPRRQPAS